MAKFKKKKSAPTTGPEDSKKESVKENPVDVPETEKSEPVEDNSSTDPPVSVAEKSEKDRKLNKLFWMRVALAVIAGTAATFIFEDIEGEDQKMGINCIYDYSVLWNNYSCKRDENATTIIR